MADRPVFLYAAVYDEIADAEADYKAVFELPGSTFSAFERPLSLPTVRVPAGG